MVNMMSSKQLDSILSSIPAATAKGQTLNNHNGDIKVDVFSKKIHLDKTRIVATIPQILKDEIKQYLKDNKGETETTVILRSLKKMGFNVDSSWLIDKRSLR